MVETNSILQGIELPTQQSFQFFCFPSVFIKKKLHENLKFYTKKNSNLFLFFFLKFKKCEILGSAPSLGKWNKSAILFYLWNCRRRYIFCRAPKKCIFSMQIVFCTFYRKSLKTNYVRDLMIHMFCLDCFSFRWIINVIKKPSIKFCDALDHCKTLVKHHETLIKHCEIPWNPRTLHLMWRYRRSMRRHQRSATGVEFLMI